MYNFLEVKEDMRNFIEQMRKDQKKEKLKRLKEEMGKNKRRGRKDSEECNVF